MQCYCTLKAVQKAYPDAQVEVIDYSAWKVPMRPYLSNISFQSLKNDCVRILKYRKFFREELTLSSNKLISPNVNKALEFLKRHNYDAIFIGADTVLELRGAPKDGLTAYWLDNRIDSKKFLIAASSHNVTFERLSDTQKERMQRTIDDFSLLGVRDDATFRLLSHFTNRGDKRLQIIPDPTFTYDIDYSYIDHYLTQKNVKLNKPIVCLHLLRDSRWASALANCFRKEGYIIASLRPAYYADVMFTDLSPLEQMGVYKYFNLVITTRFHDSIFCFKNMTPVIVFAEHVSDVTSFGESKYKTLFSSFGLDSTHYIANKNMLTAEYLFDIHRDAIKRFNDNEDRIRKVLREHKKTYEAFLDASTSYIR